MYLGWGLEAFRTKTPQPHRRIRAMKKSNEPSNKSLMPGSNSKPSLASRTTVYARASFVASVLITFLPCLSAHSQSLSSGGLSELPLLGNAETRMVSPENPTGEKGKGAMAVPNPRDPTVPFSKPAEGLGRGWKVNPFFKVGPHQTVTLMDVSGPGTIQHIWMTTAPTFEGNGRAGVLRFYWDGESSPSVEVPLTDFFAIGHDKFAPVNSLAVVDIPATGLNCYWPMPFRKHARITFTNDADDEPPLLGFQITYALTPIPANAGYFHAQWRRAVVDKAHPDYVILDGVKGKGRYVGTFLAWTQLSDGWIGEGEVKFYLDGDGEFPTLVGSGTEDYFGSSYGFPKTYTTPYLGNTLQAYPTAGSSNFEGPPKWSMYRWHLMDPINFQKDLRVTVQSLTSNGKFRPRDDDLASVAYWYQLEPHAPFPKLPPLSERWPR
jgi:hypothetical protein